MTENSYRESNIDFVFPEDAQILKFDDSSYYRSYFNRLPGGKGVDFIVDTRDRILLIEVKNCTGFERENRHRTRTNTSHTSDIPAAVINSSERFSTEIPVKVAMSLACLMGAHTKSQSAETARELEPYFQTVISNDICMAKKEIVVILVLEGNFKSHTRSKKAIMQSIQNEIRKKLKWFACKKVYVVDSSTYREQYFKMIYPSFP